MKKYEDWLRAFVADKAEVPSTESSDKFAVHSLRRFLEGKNRLWEIAITYTGRLVVRSGEIGGDGVTVVWKEWITQHDVEIPKASK